MDEMVDLLTQILDELREINHKLELMAIDITSIETNTGNIDVNTM